MLFLHYPWTGPNVWMPYVDGPYVKDPVLPEDPEKLLRSGKFSKVIVIAEQENIPYVGLFLRFH